MGWKTSKPHGDETSKPIGRHKDIYKTNDAGKRVKGEKKGKISYDEKKPEVRDIKPPPPKPR